MSIRPLFAQNDSPQDGRANPEASIPNRRSVSVTAATSSDNDRRTKASTAWLVLLVIGFLVLLVSKASAQQSPYDSIEMPEQLKDEAVVRSVESKTKTFATTGTGNARLASGYFTVYVPAKMTGPDGLKHISQLTKETLSLLTRSQRSNRPQVAQQITRFIYDGMKKVAEGNYHPAARINALIILSRLDRQLANTSTRSPPIPLREALPILMAQYENENNVDGVRAAALHGLHRQVSFGFPQIAPADRAKIGQMMSDLLEASPPQSRSELAHAYLQRFAVDILDVLQTAEDKTLGTKLISVSTQPANPDLIALYSASRLAKMGPQLQGQIDSPETVLNSWAKRTLAAFEAEVSRLNALTRPDPDRSQPAKPESLLEKKTTESTAARMSGGGMGSMESMMDAEMMSDMMPDMDMEDMGMGMMDMSAYGMGLPGATVDANPQPPEVIASRQKLNNVLQQIHMGVTGQPTAGLPTRTAGGILASVADDKKKVVEDWVTAMEEVVTGLNDRSMDDRTKYRDGLLAQIEILKGIAGVESDAPADQEIKDQFAPVDPLAQFDPNAAEPNAAEPNAAEPNAADPNANAANAPAPAPAAPAAGNDVTNDLVSP